MAHPSSTPQTFVGLYDFKETLGEGHFSVVKLAQHVISKQRVAVKIIDKLRLQPDELQHLHHEVRVMKLIRHPSVVRLYQVVDTAKHLYLILELGSGGDLFEHIMTHGAFPEGKARKLFMQIASAVAYCHQHKIVHRDLKPENVVFKGEEHENVKVTDFGLSNNFKEDELMKTMCGSLCYSAPEVLLSEPYYGPAADVWSLGVILYMMVVGKLPFMEHSDSATLVKIMDVDYRRPANISKECQDLLVKLLVRDPALRITTDEVLKHPFFAGEPIPMPMRQTNINLTPDDHEAVVRIMATADIEKTAVEQSLLSEKYDYVASTYYLLAEQQLRKKKQKLEHSASHSEMEEGGLDLAEAVHAGSHYCGLRRNSAAPQLLGVAGKAAEQSPCRNRVVPSSKHRGSLRQRPLHPRPLSVVVSGADAASNPIGVLSVPGMMEHLTEGLSLSPRYDKGASLSMFRDLQGVSPPRNSQGSALGTSPDFSPGQVGMQKTVSASDLRKQDNKKRVFPNKELPAMNLTSPHETPPVSDTEDEVPVLPVADLNAALAAVSNNAAEQRGRSNLSRPGPLVLKIQSCEDPGPPSGSSQKEDFPEWTDVLTPSWGKKFKIPTEFQGDGSNGSRPLPPSPSTPNSAPPHRSVLIGDATPTAFPSPLDMDTDSTPVAPRAGGRFAAAPAAPDFEDGCDHTEPLPNSGSESEPESPCTPSAMLVVEEMIADSTPIPSDEDWC